MPPSNSPFEQSSGDKVLTKDRAYIAAGKVIGRMKSIQGVETNKFLEENFKSIWDDHDSSHLNMISQEEGKSFMQDLIEK